MFALELSVSRGSIGAIAGSLGAGFAIVGSVVHNGYLFAVHAQAVISSFHWGRRASGKSRCFSYIPRLPWCTPTLKLLKLGSCGESVGSRCVCRRCIKGIAPDQLDGDMMRGIQIVQPIEVVSHSEGHDAQGW